MGFLSFAPPFKIKLNGSDLQMESRTLVTPREVNSYLDIEVIEVVQEKENESAIQRA